MSGRCSQPACIAPDDVGCMVGEASPQQCKHWQGGSDEQAQSAAADTEASSRLPWTGNAMGSTDVSFLAGRTRTRLVGVFGASGTGKTSMLGAWYPAANVQVLRNAEASRDAIIAGIEKLATDAQPSDTVVLYFSGHGAQRLSGPDFGTYLCPPEFHSLQPRETGIEAEELSDLLKQIQAQRVLVLVDACHSGAAARIKAEGDETLKWEFGGAKLEKLAEGTGRVILSASEANEESAILGRHRNSLFTHFLLKGLQGAVADRSDGLIRVLDLFHYVAEEVSKLRCTQNPVMTSRIQDNFPVALRKGGRLKSEEPSSDVELAEHDIAPARELEDLMVDLYPQGPLDREIWSRAGGSVANLHLGNTGRAAWHAALRTLAQGGGGTITVQRLLSEAATEFGNNADLKRRLQNS